MVPASAGRPAAPPPLDAFLSAGLGLEPNGMTLSMVSALARLNLDPHREATRLSELPRREASSALAGLVARVHAAGAFADTTDIAALIRLLPERALPHAAAAEPGGGRRGWTRMRIAQIGAIAILAAAVLYLYAAAPAPPPDQPLPAWAAGNR